MVHPSAKKRGADSQVPNKPKDKTPKDPVERKLEQGLEESTNCRTARSFAFTLGRFIRSCYT